MLDTAISASRSPRCRAAWAWPAGARSAACVARWPTISPSVARWVRARSHRLLLEQFVDFADAADTDTITTQLAVQWATLPSGSSSTWHAQRLSVVRCFTARWGGWIRPSRSRWICCRPAPGAPRRICMPMPGIVAALMAGAGRLRSPLAAATMQTFIGLVFATGLRRGEALGLDRGDFDPATGVHLEAGGPRALCRQGTRTALHAAHRPDGRGAAGLAGRTTRPTRGSVVPD